MSGVSIFINCFVAPYTAELCCSTRFGGDGNKACWNPKYNYAMCCIPRVYTRGNEACWRSGYSFDECCGPGGGPSHSACWDSNFSHERCCEGATSPDDPELTSNIVMWDRLALVEKHGTYPCPKYFWQDVLDITTSYLASQANGMPTDQQKNIGAHVTIDIYNNPEKWKLLFAACPIGMVNLVELTFTNMANVWSYEQVRALYSSSLIPIDMEMYKDTAWVNLRLQHPERKLILGLAPHTCPGDVKVYVYPHNLDDATIHCANKMTQCAGSVYILRYLLTATRGPGSCMTDDPTEADLFIFPNYEGCYNSTVCDRKSPWCYPPNFSVSALPYFSRRQGMDHVFLYMCNLSPFMYSLTQETRQSIWVTTESYQNNQFLAWFSFWKDVMMPGYIPFWRLQSMRLHNLPTKERVIKIAFHAHSRRSHAAYAESVMSMTRDRIVDELKGLPGVSVSSGYIASYFARMGSADFCLVVAGLTAWTIHLYESFFFGCIPVILSDELTVPFQDLIDWSSVSFKVPRSTNLTKLYYKLRAVSTERRHAMRERLNEYSCWFDYSNWEGECSPFRALLRYLGRKSLELNVGDPYTRIPRFWN